MKPIAGINRDVNPIDQPPNTLRFAANGVISESTGLAMNIRDELAWDDFGEDYIVAGRCTGNHYLYYFVANTTSGNGEIWRVNPDISSSAELMIIDSNNALGLYNETDNGNLIQVVYEQNSESEEIFAWAGLFKAKILNLTKVLIDSGWVSGTPIDLGTKGYVEKDFLLFPEGQLLNPQTSIQETGGNIYSGAWMFCYQYVYEDNASTNFSGISNPTYIAKLPEGDFAEIGDEGNFPTTKSIKITFTPDTTQNANVSIRFGYISIRSGVVYAGILAKKFAADLNGEFVYTGELPEIDLGDNIEELISPKGIYSNVQTITSLTSRLYVANAKKQDEINLQEVANGVTVSWVHHAQVEGINQATFGAGEVYGFYMTALYTDGTESRAFHIPGRKYIAPDPGNSIPGDDDAIQDSLERWQLYDTVDASGRMGYWVNKDELYPNSPEFASAIDAGSPYERNVRLHRFPTIGFMVDLDGTTRPGFDAVFGNIDLTGISTRVMGINIYYAKRTYGDMLNYSSEFALPAGIRDTATSTSSLVPIAANFAYTDLDNAADVVLDDDVIPVDSVMRFHGLHLLKDMPAINPVYLVKEYQYANHALSSEYLVDSAKWTPEGGTTEVILERAYKYGFVAHPSGTPRIPPETERYFLLDNYAYINTGVKYNFLTNTLFDNSVGENTFAVYDSQGFNGPAGNEIIYSTVPANPGDEGLYRFGNSAAVTIFTFASLRAVPENVCSPFSHQPLVFCKSTKITAGAVIPNITIEAKHGDKYNGDYQFNSTGVAGRGPDFLSDDPTANFTVVEVSREEQGMYAGEGSKFALVGSAQFPINHNAQYVEAGDVQSHVPYIYGGTGSGQGYAGDYDTDTRITLAKWWCNAQNIYAPFTYYYNDDFHKKSEYHLYGINDGYFVDRSTFPSTIFYSGTQNANEQNREWRTWPILNKYVQPSEKGEIINLQSAGNQMLYIHHRYSLYVTKDRISMKGGSTDVVLGSSDIFQITPYEIVSVDEGHTGIANRNWQTMTPFGYAWIQTDHGKVYIHDGQNLEEISANGMRTYFRDKLMASIATKSSSFFIVNDDLRRRIIVGLDITLTTSDILGTFISYSTAGKFWSFFQDMRVSIPIVARDKRVFMCGSTGASGHYNNIKTVAEGDFNNLLRPFILEPVVNDGKASHKYLQSVRWNSNFWLNGVDVENVTFNKIIVYSDTKIYGEPDGSGQSGFDVNLIPYTGWNIPGQNVRRLEDSWSTNAFRDLWDGTSPILLETVDYIGPNADAIDTGKEWFEKARMRDKYLIVRLIYEADDAHKIEVESIDFGIKQSIR